MRLNLVGAWGFEWAWLAWLAWLAHQGLSGQCSLSVQGGAGADGEGERREKVFEEAQERLPDMSAVWKISQD